MGSAIFTRCALRIVKRRGEKARVRNEVEKTLVLGLVVRKAPSALATRETEGEGETLRSDLSWFYFYCARPREGDDLSIISLRRPRDAAPIPDITNVTCAVFVLVFAFHGATKTFGDNTRRDIAGALTEVISLWNCDEIESISAHPLPSRANVFYGRQKFAEFESLNE